MPRFSAPPRCAGPRPRARPAVHRRLGHGRRGDVAVDAMRAGARRLPRRSPRGAPTTTPSPSRPASRPTGRWSSRSPTPAAACRPRCWRGCSRRSSRPSRSASAPASGCRSASASSPASAARSPSPARSDAGTTFRIVLPRARREDSGERPAPLIDPVPRRRGRILVIDDEPMITKALGRTLAADHAVISVGSAGEAMALLATAPPFDVILCDVRFPGRRKHKHYFPVHARDPLFSTPASRARAVRTHVVGVDQTLVDIDARVPDELIARYELPKGASTVIDRRRARTALYDELLADAADLVRVRRRHRRQHAAQLLAARRRRVDLARRDERDHPRRHLGLPLPVEHLEPRQPRPPAAGDGPIGRCFALVTPDGERTFAISEGEMNQLRPRACPRPCSTTPRRW
jgi:hypothetical protein